jgi:hypothetical protein
MHGDREIVRWGNSAISGTSSSNRAVNTALNESSDISNEQRGGTSEQNFFCAFDGRGKPGAGYAPEVQMNTETMMPRRMDQNEGPSRYRTKRPTAQPISVFATRELNARKAALSSGSVTVMTEISAQSGLCRLVRLRTNHTRTQPMKIRTAYCRKAQEQQERKSQLRWSWDSLDACRVIRRSAAGGSGMGF